MSQSLHYKQYAKNYVAIDSIIFGFDDGKLKLLLIKRKFEPCLGQWSLMGGFVGENESLDEAAYRILENLTGLRNLYLEQLYTYGDVDRDSEARVISVAYYALIKIDDYDCELGRRHGAEWFAIDEVPPLVFDHKIMVDRALRRLKRKTIIQPIGFELLPEKFTMPQLQKLYEAIHRKDLDKRNFRKKILSMGVMQKLDEKETHTSKRGAYLYKFDKNRYDYLINNGNMFDFV